MCLKHANAVVPVYYEPGKTVSLTVDKPEAVGPVGWQSKRLPLQAGSLDGNRPKIRRKRVAGKAQHPYGDRAYLVMARCQELPLCAMYGNYVPLVRVTLYLSYGT